MIPKYFRTKFCQHLYNLLHEHRWPTGWLIRNIPDDAKMCRHIIWAHMFQNGTIDPRTIFQFTEEQDYQVSVCWRKLLPTDRDVHDMGLESVAERNVGRPDSKRQIYMGFRESVVGPLRAVVTGRGHSVKVVHAPSEGCHHTHLEIVPAGGAVIEKNDRREIAHAVFECFSSSTDYRSEASDAIRAQLS